MSGFDGTEPHHGEPEWWDFYDIPEVDSVELLEDTVRVHLHSGIELEWSRGRSRHESRPDQAP